MNFTPWRLRCLKEWVGNFCTIRWLVVTLNTGNSGTVFSNKGVFVFLFFVFLGTSEKTKEKSKFLTKF